MNAVIQPQRYLINVEQYHRMGEAGVFAPGTPALPEAFPDAPFDWSVALP
jgi:hypothetical protein